MRRLIVWVLLILFIVSCGRTAPPLSTPAPDSEHSTFLSADVTIDTGAVTLAGTLLTPLGETPAPAVILIPGSGAATRDGSWNMYRKIGEDLVQRGSAVLLYDKRGVRDSPLSPQTQIAQYVALPLLWNAAIAYVLLVTLPKAFEVDISTMILLQPDVSWVAVISGVFAIAWGLLRTGIVITELNKGEFRLSG